MGIFKGLLRLIVGTVFGAAGALAITPAVAAFNDGSGNNAWAFYLVLAIGAALGAFAPTIRRAFGRGFILAGVCVFALPLSMMMLSGRVASDMAADSANQGAAMAGAGIAGAMMTGAAGSIGFFLGTILLVIGLVLTLGGRREVIVVNQYSPPPAGTASSGRQEPRF